MAGVLAAGAEIAVLGSRQGVLDVGYARIGHAEHSFGRSQGFKRVVSTAGQSIAFLLAAGGLFLLSVTKASVNFATVGTITVLLLRGVGLAQQVQAATGQYGAVLPFIDQVRTLLDRYEAHRQSFGSAAFPDSFDVVLDEIAYTYPGTQASAIRVDHAAFLQGSSTAIVGPSGSGKSTLIQLLLRLRLPSQGGLTVGGLDLQSISEQEFSTHFAYVPQSPVLVPGTILENIRFFRSGVSDADVVRAAKLAHIHEDIERMSSGYETVIDAHVDALSGGQKQRLALARALTSSPSVVVLDEPTSALDATNEAAVIDTLRQLHGSTTIIMITHKLSTVAHCDAVLHVEHGQLVTPALSAPAGD